MKKTKYFFIYFYSIFFLSITILFSLFYGIDNLNNENNSVNILLTTIRIPRILGDIIVGSSLAISGSLTQGITKNKLADCGVLGINSGAALGLSIYLSYFNNYGYYIKILITFIGASISLILILFLSNKTCQQKISLKIILIGIGINCLFISLCQFLSLYNNLNQTMIYWYMGGLNNVTWPQVIIASPIFIFFLIVSILYSKITNLLACGDFITLNLGFNPKILRLMFGIIIIGLSGLSVSLVGPISFIGIIIPNLVRIIYKDDYSNIVPLSAIWGANLVLVSDTLTRIITHPQELPFGVLISLLGAPIFIILLKKSEFQKC